MNLARRVFHEKFGWLITVYCVLMAGFFTAFLMDVFSLKFSGWDIAITVFLAAVSVFFIFVPVIGALIEVPCAFYYLAWILNINVFLAFAVTIGILIAMVLVDMRLRSL